MVCWAQQFESLTNYAYRQVHRKRLRTTIDVEQACNHALLQWLEYKGAQDAHATLAENGIADPPPLLKRMVKFRLLDKGRAEAIHPVSSCDAEWFDRIADPSEQHLHCDSDASDSDAGDEIKRVGDRNQQSSAMLEKLAAYINRRSPKTRDLLYMRLAMDMPSSEVAEILGLTENAVNCAVYRLTSFMKNAP